MVDTLDPGQACPGVPTTWGMHSLLAVRSLAYVSRGNQGEGNVQELRMFSSQTRWPGFTHI